MSGVSLRCAWRIVPRDPFFTGSFDWVRPLGSVRVEREEPVRSHLPEPMDGTEGHLGGGGNEAWGFVYSVVPGPFPHPKGRFRKGARIPWCPVDVSLLPSAPTQVKGRSQEGMDEKRVEATRNADRPPPQTPSCSGRRRAERNRSR